VIFLGAGRALLLQLAHPWVAKAIIDHSHALSDPIGRFHRTFNPVFTIVFGSLDQALAAAVRLHRRHAGIKGQLSENSPYWAREPSALYWVHATLVDTMLAVYQLILPPLTPDERERYYRETMILGRAFGIPVRLLPPSWEDFVAGHQAMWASAKLEVAPDTRLLAHRLLDEMRAPHWYRAVTARLLPRAARAAFALPYRGAEVRSADTALSWIGRLYPLLPERVRYVGPYQEAKGRASGSKPPDFITRWLNRLWIGQATMKVV
jgi:uncharacterized protein (DUF2236 family)